MKSKHLKNNIAIPPLFVEGDNHDRIKLKHQAKLVCYCAKKFVRIANRTNRITDVLHQKMRLMNRRNTHNDIAESGCSEILGIQYTEFSDFFGIYSRARRINPLMQQRLSL